MKLIIAGYGYVGKAYHAILKNSWDIEIHDPSLGYVADFDNVCQGIICCVSTPTNQIKTFNTTFSPEFLRANTALQDLADTKVFELAKGDTNFWATILIEALGKVTVNTKSSAEELILIKYFRNAFLANKVAFFNQIYDLCQATNIDYDVVSSGIGKDPRIGDSHTDVTDARGFGGHCFPKDTNAIVKTADQRGVDLSLLKSTIAYNYQIRKDNV